MGVLQNLRTRFANSSAEQCRISSTTHHWKSTTVYRTIVQNWLDKQPPETRADVLRDSGFAGMIRILLNIKNVENYTIFTYLKTTSFWMGRMPRYTEYLVQSDLILELVAVYIGISLDGIEFGADMIKQWVHEMFQYVKPDNPNTFKAKFDQVINLISSKTISKPDIKAVVRAFDWQKWAQQLSSCLFEVHAHLIKTPALLQNSQLLEQIIKTPLGWLQIVLERCSGQLRQWFFESIHFGELVDLADIVGAALLTSCSDSQTHLLLLFEILNTIHLSVT